MHIAARLSPFVLALVPAAAFAHPGHGDIGFAAGLAHPLLGVDHLAAAAFTGAWAAQRGGALRAVLPATFVAAMILGVFCAPAFGGLTGAVDGILGASVLVTGLGLAFASRLPAWPCVAVAAAFAFCHGLAHGAEQPSATLGGYASGLAVTTTMLLAAGLLVALAARGHRAASATQKL